VELGNTGINTQLRGVLASGVDPNFGPGPVLLRERVDSQRVNLLGLAFSYLCQSLFSNVSTPVHGLRCARNALHGVSLPEDVMRWEARRVCSELLWAWRQRRQVEGYVELACPLVADTGRSSPDTSALANRNTLHPF
jgi:hypothetical protein